MRRSTDQVVVTSKTPNECCGVPRTVMEPAPQTAHSIVTRGHFMARAWEKIATGLAVIGLIDLSGQLIKWAAAVHWLIDKYRIMKVWLFA